jgi:ribosome-associated translation inhibitor RaiA
MEKSSMMEEAVHKELQKLNKFISLEDPLVSINLVITAEGPTHRLYTMELVVTEPRGMAVSRVEEYDFNQALDAITNKMLRELADLKSRSIDELKESGSNQDSPRRDKERFEK